MVLDLTAAEFAILKHRLEVPDAIADCVPGDKVEDVIDALIVKDWEAAIAIDKETTFNVLEDCVDGSTLYGAAINNVSAQSLAAIYRVGCSLASKVSAAIGRDVRFPKY